MNIVVFNWYVAKYPICSKIVTTLQGTYKTTRVFGLVIMVQQIS